MSFSLPIFSSGVGRKYGLREDKWSNKVKEGEEDRIKAQNRKEHQKREKNFRKTGKEGEG